MMNEFKTIAEIAAEIGVTRQAIYLKLKNNDLSEAVKPFTEKQGKVTRYSNQGIQLIKESFTSNTVNDDLTEEVKRLTNDLTESKDNCLKLSNDLNNCKAELDKALKEIETLKQTNNELTAKTSTLDNLTDKCKGLENNCQVLETKLSEKENYISSLEADKARANDKADYLVKQLEEKEASAKEERKSAEKERQTILTRLWQTEDEKKALETELKKYKSLVDSQQVQEGESVKEEPSRDHTEPKQPEPQKRSFFKRLFGKK